MSRQLPSSPTESVAGVHRACSIRRPAKGYSSPQLKLALVPFHCAGAMGPITSACYNTSTGAPLPTVDPRNMTGAGCAVLLHQTRLLHECFAL